MTLKRLEAARDKAERRMGEWYDKYCDALEWYCVYDAHGRMISLKEFYLPLNANGRDISDAIEADKLSIYEEDLDADKNGVYKPCTRQAVKLLRRIATSIVALTAPLKLSMTTERPMLIAKANWQILPVNSPHWE